MREFAVRVVLHDRDARALGERHQAFAPVRVERHARRVVQRGLHVNEARLARAQDRLDVIDAQAVVVDGDRNGAQARDLKDLQRPGIRRLLDDDFVAGLRERLRHERDALRRAGQDQHVARVGRTAARAHARCDRFAQRRVAFGIAVREHVIADRPRRAETTSRVRRAATDRRAARPARTRCVRRGTSRRVRPSTCGNEPTRHGGSVIHHGTSAERGRMPARSARRASPSRRAVRSSPSATSSRYACTTVLRLTANRSASARSGGRRVNSGSVPVRIASRSSS